MDRRWGGPYHSDDEEVGIDDSGDFGDVEKYGYYDRDDSIQYNRRPIQSPYSSSSRETSGSHNPMLRGRAPKRHYGFHFYRIPHKTAKYLCLILATAILLFILHLIRMSWISSKQLELEKPADKPTLQTPLWESFNFLKRYHGGIRTLVSKSENIPEYPTEQQSQTQQNQTQKTSPYKIGAVPKSRPFDPYPDYKSEAYIRQFEEKQECFLDEESATRVPKVHCYDGVTGGFPDVAMGSHEVLNLRDDVCFDRFGRYGPYGYGYSVKRGGLGAGLHGDREGADEMWSGTGNSTYVDYSKIRWATVQDTCLSKNAQRFKPDENVKQNLFQDFGTGTHAQSSDKSTVQVTSSVGQSKPKVPRSAILLRVWWDMEYTPEDILYLRSLISELSLNTGGEYTIHFLVHVKDDNVPIWADQKIYNRILENALPVEFQGMGTLWSEKQMSLIYGGLMESFFRDLPVHGVYRSTYMPIQYFAHQHPEFDYFWNWEMDIRYTGQWYHLLDKVRSWTKAQPRKGLWERNGRFYIPSVHGTWEDFRQMVRVQTEMGTDHPNNMWSSLKMKDDGRANIQPKHDTPVWGPLSPSDMLKGQESVTPPTTPEHDKYEWGVGEESDLITFNPLFDPDGTTWFFANDLTGYNTSVGLPPRRAAISTTTRLSRRLLTTMHRETMLARHAMFSEMWPASIALHHGYKAVYAPHPVYIDRNWPSQYLNDVFNAGRNGATGGSRTGVFGNREHNFKGTTWFYDAGFAPNLWRRWLGYKVDGDGGEKAEMAGEGRMCLPGVLLHPVKGVRMGTEGGERIKEDNL